MSTEEHLTKLKTEELRVIIRSLKLKTSIKGYSKMRHADLVQELAKLLSVENDNGELVLNVKQVAPTESFRITLKETPVEVATASHSDVEGGAIAPPAAVSAPKKPSKVDAPENLTLEEFAQQQDGDSDEATTSTSVGKRVPALKKKAPRKVKVQSEPSL